MNRADSISFTVHATGGLADTIVDHTDAETSPPGNGFSFAPCSAGALSDALTRAVAIYRQSDAWHQLVRTGMQQDWSWARSARQYDQLYSRMLVGSRQ